MRPPSVSFATMTISGVHWSHTICQKLPRVELAAHAHRLADAGMVTGSGPCVAMYDAGSWKPSM